MRNQEVKETYSIPKEVSAPQKTEGLTSATLSVDEAQTWAMKLFGEGNKPIPVLTEMSSKAPKKIKPDNQAKKTFKTGEFSSSSKAPELLKNMLIPGLFVENPELSKREQRAKRFKVRRLPEKVIQLYYT